MKRFLAFLTSMILCVTLLAGCGSSKPAETKTTSDKKYTIRVALVSSDAHLHNIVMNEWAEDAKEKTDGRLEIKVMGSSQLGGERDYIEGMQLGNIEMSQVSAGPVSGFIQDFTLLSMPYFFEDYAEMEEVFTGEISDNLFTQMEDLGIKGLTWFTNGFRNVYTADKAVTEPEDLNGLKIRVMESQVMISTLNAMGASATPMAYGELYAAIQQGVMDGAENSLGNIYSDKYFEICNNVSLTEHFAPPGVVAISQKAFDDLPADLQEYLVTSAKEFGKIERTRDEELQNEMAKTLEDNGMAVNKVNKESFIAATKPIYVEMKDKLSPEIVKMAENLGKSFS